MAAGIPSDEDDDPSIEGNTNHNQLLEEGLYELSVNILQEDLRSQNACPKRNRGCRVLSYLRTLRHTRSAEPLISRSYSYTRTATSVPASEHEEPSSLVQGTKYAITKFAELTLQMILSHNRIGLALLVVPTAIIIGLVDVHPAIIFVANLVAVIPLSIVLTIATENLARDLGPTAGALLNISCGNLAEVIILTALSAGHIRVVQSSLLGSILVNLLLVLGLSIVIGGMSYKEQVYNNTTTQLFISLMNLAVFSLIIPTAFYGSLENEDTADHSILTFSRAISVTLLVVYILYLVFQFKSHPHLFQPIDILTGKEEVDVEHKPAINDQNQGLSYQSYSAPATYDYRRVPVEDRPDFTLSPSQPPEPDRSKDESSSSELRTTWTNRLLSILLLGSSTFFIGVCADTVVTSFRALNERGVLRESFVGLIVLPIAGNIAEILTATIVAGKGEMDLAINIALGSAIQIALLVTPLMVIVGWILRTEMALHFDLFETAAMIMTALMVSFLIVRGKTNWFEGGMMLACFVGIAIGAYLLPDEE